MAEGTCIAVPDSTELAGLSPSGLALGTRVWNIGVGAFFQLKASTASLITNQIVAVSGTTGVRWIVVTEVSNPVETVTSQTANAIDETDPANPILKNAGASNAGTMSAANFTLLGSLPAATKGVRQTVSGSAAQDITFTGLTGDTDGGYLISGSIVTADVNPVLRLQINGVDVGHSNGTFVDKDGVVAGNGITAYLYIVSNADANSAFVTFHIRIGSKHGELQPFSCQAFSGRSDYAVSYQFQTSGQFTPAAEITSIRIHSTVAAALNVGSFAVLQKLGVTA